MVGQIPEHQEEMDHAMGIIRNAQMVISQYHQERHNPRMQLEVGDVAL